MLKVLSSRERNSQIQCQIDHVDLDDNPSFEALSYTWGDADDPRTIQIDSHLVSITANLEVALRNLRHNPGVQPYRVLWVDAVCINQLDLAEKSSQIRMMYEIYASASPVIAWTGEASDGVEKAFQAATALANAIFACLSSPAEGNTSMPSFIAVAERFTFHGLNWDSLWSFLQRPYFTRIWIVQELSASVVTTARETWVGGAIVYAGPTTIKAMDLMTVSSWINAVNPQFTDILSPSWDTYGSTRLRLLRISAASTGTAIKMVR